MVLVRAVVTPDKHTANLRMERSASPTKRHRWPWLETHMAALVPADRETSTEELEWQL